MLLMFQMGIFGLSRNGGNTVILLVRMLKMMLLRMLRMWMVVAEAGAEVVKQDEGSRRGSILVKSF